MHLGLADSCHRAAKVSWISERFKIFKAFFLGADEGVRFVILAAQLRMQNICMKSHVNHVIRAPNGHETYTNVCDAYVKRMCGVCAMRVKT